MKSRPLINPARLALSLAAFLLAACSVPIEAQEGWPELTFTEVADGFTRPVDIQSPQDGSGRLFIVEQAGRIQVLKDGQKRLVLDIAERVEDRGNEQGLLGLAFPPGRGPKSHLYLNYTRPNGEEGKAETVVSRFFFRADGETIDPQSEVEILTVDQPYRNHNGGDLAFGPDGYLYIGLGDGGSSQDPEERAQDGQALLGKMLRIDVESANPRDPGYRIPPDNPFVGAGSERKRPEIWALGLRNPWRYSFDRETGDLYIADVGQNQLEEIDFQPAGSRGGENYGWDFYEASLRQPEFNPNQPPPPSELTFPVAEYPRAEGCSVTGGYVYRGPEHPPLQGIYLFADYCTGFLWGMRQDSSGGWSVQRLAEREAGISTFAEGEDGTLYYAGLASGRIHRIGATAGSGSE